MPIQTLYSYEQIKHLFKSGQTQEAYNSIEAFLQSNPKDSRAINLSQKIKRQITKDNIQKINQAIQRFDYLEDQKKYRELLEAYLKIHKYAPDYIPLNKKIEKVYRKLNSQNDQSNNQDFQNINKIVQTKIQNQQIQEAIQFIEQTILKDSTNPLLQKLLLNTKRTLVEQKYKKNKKALTKRTIPEAYEFIKSLYDYEPTFPLTRKLIIKQHSRLKYYYANQKTLFEKDAKRQIKILFNTKDYKNCIQACNDLLKAIPANKFALKYKKKADNKVVGLNFAEAYEKLTAYLKTI
jgi:hypothetical protein